MKNRSLASLILAAAMVLAGAGCKQTANVTITPSTDGATADSEASVQGSATSSEETDKSLDVDQTSAGKKDSDSDESSEGLGVKVETENNAKVEIQAVPVAVPAPIAIKTFTVVASNFAFDVKTIKVKQGEKVRIVFKNSGGTHDWKIDEFKAATQRIGAGAEETIEFTADKKGTFEYYCSVGSHRAAGMKGTLVVE